MADSVLAARDRLISANAWAAIAMERGAKKDQRRAAVRGLARALRRFVDNDEVRDALLDMAGPGVAENYMLPHVNAAPDLVQAVADMLTEEHARLLVVTGYKAPPPPPAYQLIEQTRQAVLRAPQGADYGVAHIETMYMVLRQFLKELDDHSKATQSRLRRMLGDSKKVTLIGVLLTQIYNTEFKVGDSFDVDASFSGREKLKIEVTVPDEWGTAAFGHLLATGASNVMVQTIADAEMMQLPAMFNYQPELEQSLNRDLAAISSAEAARRAVERAAEAAADFQRTERQRAAEEDDYQRYDSSSRDDDGYDSRDADVDSDY